MRFIGTYKEEVGGVTFTIPSQGPLMSTLVVFEETYKDAVDKVSDMLTEFTGIEDIELAVELNE